jgi:two-component system, cell cycle response regulator DivK
MMAERQRLFTMPAKILIVEDNADSRDILSYLLKQKGFAIMCAENGAEALNKLAAERPELIITDISMPVMDGVEMIKKLREVPELKPIPVLVISAFRSGIVRDAMQAGANAAAAKPLEFENLFALINHLLES